MRRFLSVFAGLVGLAGSLLIAPAAHADTATGFPSVNGDWMDPGPYSVSVRAESVTTFYYPSDITTNPLRHPVIIWGNGTGATTSVYDGMLRHWATEGFIVAAANTTQSNSGSEMLAGIDRLTTLNADSTSPFYGKVDLTRIGASGHSQGGAGAINASADPRVDTTVPMAPGPLASSSRLHGPTLFLAGQLDTIVYPSWVYAFYSAATQVPAEYTMLAGATHFTEIGSGGNFAGISTAWFRFQLMGDEQARSKFFGPNCGICSGNTWLSTARNSLALAVPGS